MPKMKAESMTGRLETQNGQFTEQIGVIDRQRFYKYK